jgi:hypothetical protein
MIPDVKHHLKEEFHKINKLWKPKELNQYFKEVLRRENQGLKVYPVDDSSFFSMTGTYFW